MQMKNIMKLTGIVLGMMGTICGLIGTGYDAKEAYDDVIADKESAKEETES